ncbi:hypothetical protein BJY52DRAFT_1197992 [Lactarius psammicola]|nr:hypothetical protein BJY52DRAFT_1197992 [Lactarius psammicola]
MEQNNQPPPSPQHVPWSPDPVPHTPSLDPNDTAHLLAHITTFNKDPIPSQPYHAIMDAGFNPNTQVISQSTSLGQQEGRADYKWLLSSQDLPQGSAEQQGSAPNRHHRLPPIETLPPLPEASFDSLQSSVQYTQPSVQEVTSREGPARGGLSENTKRFIREATANLRAIQVSRTPNCLPEVTRRIIREVVSERDQTGPPNASPEVIFVRSSTADPCDVVIPPSRPQLVASAWTHVTQETNLTDLPDVFQTQFPEIRIRDFITSIQDALRAPILTELHIPRHDPGWGDDEGELERIKTELMVELGRDVSASQTGYAHYYLTAPLQVHKDNDFPASIEGFNLSVGLVLAALDCGVEDNRGDLEQAGLTPSSWFRLASATLGAITRGALRSGGRKIQGRVRIDADNFDDWVVAEGLTAPTTQGGRIAAQANQLAEFFIHYAGTDEPPLAEFYDSVLRVGQNHIEKVVRLKAAATYQITTADVQGLTDMVLEDMSKQLYTHLANDPEARKKANQRSLDRLFVEAQQQLLPFMEEWKRIYKHSLVQALKESEEDREETPPTLEPLLSENSGYIKLFAFNRVREIRESIAREITDPVLDGDEISWARERIRLEHAEEIEEARRITRAEISLEKKAWAVAYRDSNKLDWLRKAAEELGYTLVSKDDAEEREGRQAKRHTGPSGKRGRSGSRADSVTPGSVPATPDNRPRMLDNSQTPKARKTKGKRSANPGPKRSRAPSTSSQISSQERLDVDMPDETVRRSLFFASSYPETMAALQEVQSRGPETAAFISGISVPQDVRPSQAPEAPIRDPKVPLFEPETDVSVYVPSCAPSPKVNPTSVNALPPSRALTPDSTRGVASSMHNPDNVMAVDAAAPSADSVAVPPDTDPVNQPLPPPLPQLTPIPLLPGLAEMLNALQSNLMTSFTNQISVLSSRIDAQDELIKVTKGKGKAKGAQQTPPARPEPSHSVPAVTPPVPTTATDGGASSTPNNPTIPVPNPLPTPIPPPRPAQRAILPEGVRWAGIVTSGNFSNDANRNVARTNANAVGRTASGKARPGKSASSNLTENTEITVSRGSGLTDSAAEDRLFKSNPGSIVQAARSQMERLSAQAPAVLYGRWSVNPKSHNFVYVFAGVVPFSTILQYTKALTEPLGGGNILPNKGWTFAQLRGVPTSDGAGVIHDSDTLLREIRRAPFFASAIFVSKPCWQLSNAALTHARTGVIQLAFIDENGSHSAAAKAQGVGIAADAMKLVMPQMHRRTQTVSAQLAREGRPKGGPNGSSEGPNQPPDAERQKEGKPVKRSSRNRKRDRNTAAKVAAQTANAAIPGASGSGSGITTILYPDDLASVSDTIDAFRTVAYLVSDSSMADLDRALGELEMGWGARTEHFDNLFCLPARYAVKHALPLTVPATEDAIAKGDGGHAAATKRVQDFRKLWGDSRPYHYAISQLPPNTRFASQKEVDARRQQQASAGDKARAFNEAANFITDLANSLYENNFITRTLSQFEVDFIIMDNSFDALFLPDSTQPFGDTIADAIKNHIKQDAARVFAPIQPITHA